MKKIIISIITVFIVFLFQTNLFHHLAFNGIVPDLLLIVVCCYGYMRGETSGIISGFFCGLMLDVLYSNNLGFHSIVYLYLGFFNGLLNQLYIEEDIKVPISCVCVSDLISCLMTYCLKFLLNGNFNFQFYFLHIILPEVIYTTALTVAIYPLLKLIENKLIPFTFKKEEDNNAV